MLVLRRRPNEAIVFDGGLTLTLVSVSGRVAWLGFSPGPGHDLVVVGFSGPSASSTEFSVRGPRSIERGEAVTRIGLSASSADEPDLVLKVASRPGEAIELGGITLSVAMIEEERAYVALAAPGLPGPVTISIVSISTVDARIGVDAPSELRVYRKEVWDEMQAANTGAASTWSEADLAALTVKPD